MRGKEEKEEWSGLSRYDGDGDGDDDDNYVKRVASGRTCVRKYKTAKSISRDTVPPWSVYSEITRRFPKRLDAVFGERRDAMRRFASRRVAPRRAAVCDRVCLGRTFVYTFACSYNVL